MDKNNMKDEPTFQRTIVVKKRVWEGLAGIPGGRTKLVNLLLEKAVEARYSDINKIKQEIQEKKELIENHKNEIIVLEQRLETVREQQDKDDLENWVLLTKPVLSRVAQECYKTNEMYNGNLRPANFEYLEKRSGVPANLIHDFIKSKKYHPTEQETCDFFLSFSVSK